ncbi:HNH endonuclease [Gordonia westfalica]|uniref:HNH endonuclease n=2 Tax=Gordonia westfalica TaxID=158898 RepID=A0A1H2J2G2_9ACTN|nr:HNH endonuclease signature motif containing protein [Gordonia westfalica]SDU50589.1 HNH endonuclease [Gordonia westfalica]
MTALPAWAGDYSRRLTALCLATYGDTCHLCGRPGATTADHLIPRSVSYDDSLANLRPAHQRCNSARGAMPIETWRARFTASTAPRSSRWSRPSSSLTPQVSAALRPAAFFSPNAQNKGSVHTEKPSETTKGPDNATT